ncbi:efflux RND transporter periplasmic adaptor subunit [Thiorhodovibrio litoralis]|uniref:efflux RND transporter periplasmic adaptor subunit n=2 Tax=Thiorhodovibrio TaxID=61593 RepID=UPI002B25C1EC|nr:efflux RND transporter periplasmic adaptor subunit [Thiorhodovibrio litoralis]
MSKPLLPSGGMPGCVLLLICLPLLSGCSQEAEPEGSPPVRPVKTLVVESPDLGGERNFPGRVDAEAKAELAFRVPGTVAELMVKEGDRVEKGQVLITLDATDYEIQLRNAQASFERAQNDFNRAKELVDDGFISRTDFDAKEAEYKNAQAALERAQQDVEYTQLKASFDGTISQRYVERFEEVQAKQPVLAMQDNNSLQVKVDVPENIIRGIKPSGNDQPNAERAPTWATFDSHPDQRFDLTLREVSTRADRATQTFEVTYTMPAPTDFLVFPGMTATVTADLSRVSVGERVFTLPATAVTADAQLEPFVWVVEESAMTVAKVPVEVGRLSGSSIEVAGGLEPGQRVVVAGVGYLAEGMKVRLLPQREQAQPRADEVPSS